MKIIDSLVKFLPSRPVYAHCDIPCGIYDPYLAQMAAHTVLRMTKLIEDEQSSPADKRKEDQGDESIFRMVHVKEEHAEIVKHEIATIWSDYFKEENSKNMPDLADHVWQTLKLASKAKQKVDIEVAKALLAHVQVFAEMFYQSKGMESVRIPSGYPTEGEIVTHK